eukprot:499480_1
MMPDSKSEWPTSLSYQSGFGGHFSSEALKGALPARGNNPQKCPYGLYAEQLNGTSFTTPRVQNQRSWLYRILPSVKHTPFKPIDAPRLCADFTSAAPNPNQMRWDPLPLPACPPGVDPQEAGAGPPVDFVDGLVTWMGAGSAETKTGLAIHLYSASLSMVDRAFYSADGDFLIVPQHGTLQIRTEFGLMEVPPGEIAVIQRGVKYSVALTEPSRGYVLEIFQGHFVIPDLGPIGANGLANPRDFETPVASFEDRSNCKFRLTQKFLGDLFETELDHSPFDVVAWHGNYAPYKYNLEKYCTINSVSFDHIDPSIFTVLTAQSSEPGVAVADFVIFPPRWMVAEDTFRPPYYHRNIMSEYMGSISGSYDAKAGFRPGAGSLHNVMQAHGPDAVTFEAASQAELAPVRYRNTDLAFMFESTFVYRVTPYAMENLMQEGYYECWADLKRHFDPERRE